MKDWRRALIKPTTPIIEALRLLSESGIQICLVTDENEKLVGTVTDGDIRRGILRGITLDGQISSVMNCSPRTANPHQDSEALLTVMTKYVIHQLPVVDGDGRLLGLRTLDELVRQPVHRPNWVVLMAGGQGNRLRPLTETTPKPLLRVGEKTILEHILERFIQHRFRHFYISVNYRAEMVREALGDGSRWDIDIRYLEEDRPLGTAGPLGLINNRPEHPLVVMNGDLITKIGFGNLLAFHAESSAQATMAVREYEFEVPFGVVRVDGDCIAAIDEKPVQSFLVNAGLYVLEPPTLDLLRPGDPLDMPDLFRRIVARGDKATVFPVQEYWLDIGRHDDFDRARDEFAREFPS